MTNITAFPDIDCALFLGTNRFTLECSRNVNIKAGQVVAFTKDGSSREVVPASHSYSGQTSGAVIGVATEDASSGQLFTVAGPGCWVYVANTDDTTAIDAGSWCEASNNSVKGTVMARLESSENHYTVGIALEDIAGGGTGLLLVHPTIYPEYYRA